MKLCLLAGLVWLLTACSTAPGGPAVQLLTGQQQRTGVHFTISTAHLTASPWDLRYQPVKARQQAELQQYLPLFAAEFQKMPAALVQLSALKTVAFVRQLAIASQPRAAVPDYHHEVLYYDIRPQPPAYLRHVVHHEFYHMLEQQLYGSAYYQDPDWLALNPADFRYGNGGASSRDSSAAAFSHPAPGFINGYAMSGIEEDKAEIWTVIWASDSWQQVSQMFAKDQILAAKLRLLVQQLQCRVPALKAAWPMTIRSYLPATDDCVATTNQAATARLQDPQTAIGDHSTVAFAGLALKQHVTAAGGHMHSTTQLQTTEQPQGPDAPQPTDYATILQQMQLLHGHSQLAVFATADSAYLSDN